MGYRTSKAVESPIGDLPPGDKEKLGSHSNSELRAP
jgi:hypothetical protein